MPMPMPMATCRATGQLRGLGSKAGVAGTGGVVICSWAVGSCSQINTAAWGGLPFRINSCCHWNLYCFCYGHEDSQKVYFSEGRRRSSNSAQPTTRAACAAMAQAGAGAAQVAWRRRAQARRRRRHPLVGFKCGLEAVGRPPCTRS